MRHSLVVFFVATGIIVGDSHYAQARELTASASAAANPRDALSISHARSLAIKTARHLAYEKLVETLHGLHLESVSQYRDELMDTTNIQIRSQGSLSGAYVKSEQIDVMEDRSVTATVVVGIQTGETSSPRDVVVQTQPGTEIDRSMPSASVRSELKEKPSEIEFKSKSRITGYTGLIVDARGVDYIPSEFPRILTPSGKRVYDVDRIPDNAMSRQYVDFMTSIPEACASGRAGDYPLTVDVIGLHSGNSSDLEVNDSIGDVIITEDQESGFLNQCRVVIIVDYP